MFVTYSRHNSSRKEFREKDPGYVRIRANKDLWWNLCTESNISFEVIFDYQRQRESVVDMARDAWTRNSQCSCLCPVSYVRFFGNILSPSKRQISNPHACTLALWTKPRMRISSPGTQHFPGNSLFQLFPKKYPISSHWREKRRHFGAGQKKHLRLVHVKHKCTTRSGLWVVNCSHFHTTRYIAVAVAFTASLNYYRG